MKSFIKSSGSCQTIKGRGRGYAIPLQPRSGLSGRNATICAEVRCVWDVFKDDSVLPPDGWPLAQLAVNASTGPALTRGELLPGWVGPGGTPDVLLVKLFPSNPNSSQLARNIVDRFSGVMPIDPRRRSG